tara:strand:+ start:1551 stop:1757 length:207 start_codon:yes stop_codon:yes gene_type:complete
MSDNNIEVISLPTNVVQLIEILDNIFLDESAKLEWSDREVWFRAGQRSVVNWLLELKRRTENPNDEEE